MENPLRIPMIHGVISYIFPHLHLLPRHFAGAQLGLSAAGPGLCAEALEKAAMMGELRMLSLSDGSKERLMWHGLVCLGLIGTVGP